MASGKGLRDNLVRDPLYRVGVSSNEEGQVVKHRSDFKLYSVPGSQHISGEDCPKSLKIAASGFHTGLGY